MKSRVLKLFEGMSPKPDAIVIANSVDPLLDQTFFYLFDVPSGLFEGSIEIALPDGTLHVITSILEEESARRAARRDPQAQVHAPRTKEEREGSVKRWTRGCQTIALNYRELTVEMHRTLEKLLPEVHWTDGSLAIRHARLIKDAVEVERLARAGEIGSTVANEIPSMLRAGMTELELAAEIEYRMMKNGASGRSFSTISAFGAHGAEPHYHPSDHRLEPGASIVCDFGAYFERYASDITRSFHFGPTDDEMKRVHETVEKAQRAALETIRSGVPSREVHLAAQQVIDESPWKGRFTHGLGHSIGLAVHDGWGMNHLTDDALEAGMAITVEPGIYLPGHGGVRIEDDVLVTQSGYRPLTTARRDYLEVPA